jgi:serine/threonine protein kinase
MSFLHTLHRCPHRALKPENILVHTLFVQLSSSSSSSSLKISNGLIIDVFFLLLFVLSDIRFSTNAKHFEILSNFWFWSQNIRLWSRTTKQTQPVRSPSIVSYSLHSKEKTIEHKDYNKGEKMWDAVWRSLINGYCILLCVVRLLPLG